MEIWRKMGDVKLTGGECENKKGPNQQKTLKDGQTDRKKDR